jgi:hypothetical protein
MKNSTNLENRFNKQELLEVLTRLLAQRSGFYAKVILADLGNLGHLQGSLNNSHSESKSNITSSSYQDKFAAIPSQVGLFRPPNKSPIPGLYFASSWTYPGHGFTGTIIAGYLCARQVHKFLNIKIQLKGILR